MNRTWVSIRIICLAVILSSLCVKADDSYSLSELFSVACDLRGKSESERKAAIKQITATGSRSEDYFIDMITSEATINRQVAAEILGEIGTIKSEEVLIGALRNKDVFLQGAAARGLAVLYSRLPQINLTNRLRSTSNSMVSMAVLYGAYKRARYRQERLDGELLLSVSALLGVVSDHREMQSAMMVLRYANSKEAVVALLKVAASSTNSNVLIEVCRALEAIAPEGKAVAIERLAVNGNPAIEVEAWAALSAMGYSNTDRSLAQLATNTDPKIQARAIEMLTKYGGKKYDTLYIAALNSAYPMVRLQAVYALVETGSEHSSAKISKMMGPNGDPDPVVRAEAALAFAKLSRAGGLVPLLKDSRNEQDNKLQFRLEAIRALGELGDSGALRALLDMLRDDDMLVRIAAAESLGVLGDTRALNILTEMSTQRRGDELGAIMDAIEQLRGQ